MFTLKVSSKGLVFALTFSVVGLVLRVSVYLKG